jgi:hypothetical protein
MAKNGWSRKFEDPIELPNGKQLVTLRDAALYITKLPKPEQARSAQQQSQRRRV